MHREGSWWSDCPKQKMKNLDDPEKNGNAKVYISIETADALSECKVTRDKAALIQAREFRTKRSWPSSEENAKKFGGFQVKGRRPTSPWGRLAYWWSERKKKQLAAKKVREERERAKYAAARQGGRTGGPSPRPRRRSAWRRRWRRVEGRRRRSPA